MKQVLNKIKWMIPLVVIIVLVITAGLVWSKNDSNANDTSTGEIADDSALSIDDSEMQFDETPTPEVTDETLTDDYGDEITDETLTDDSGEDITDETSMDEGTDDETGGTGSNDYGSVLVEPSALPAVLYTIEVTPETVEIPVGGKEMCTVILSNCITADCISDPSLTQHGDLTGDLVITANIYIPMNPLMNWGEYMQSWSPSPSNPQYIVTFPCVTVHPENSVTFTFPIAAGRAVPGTLCTYKVEFMNIVK